MKAVVSTSPAARARRRHSRRADARFTLALWWPPVYTRAEDYSMEDDVAGQFLELIHGLEEVRDAMTPERAHAEFDETTLQLFWKKWPSLSAWSGSLWRMLSEELAGPSSPHRDAELDEVGGSD